MNVKRFIAGLLVGGVVALGTSVLAAEEHKEAPAPEKGHGRLVTRKVFVRHVEQPRQPPPQAEPPAPFVPIVNGRLTAYYRHYPPSYSDWLLGAYGYLPPFGAYIYGPPSGYDQRLFAPENYPVQRSTRTLIVVEPPDAPGSTYFYYDSFPYYYGQPGYFPGNAYAGPGVTIVSPTVPQEAQQPEQPAAPQVQVPGELEKATFISTLAPMLGGAGRVSMDFAVGELKLHRGDYEGAAESLRRAVGDAPAEAAPKLALGLALIGASDYEGAAQIVKRGLRGMPDWRGLNLLPGRVFGTDAAYQRVLARLQGAGKADDAHFLLGFLYMAGGRYADAVGQLRLAGTKDPLVPGLMMEAQRRDENAKKPASAAPEEAAGQKEGP